MKRFTFAVVISLVIHALVIFILTGAEITHPAPGSVPGVTRATFVSINSGPAEDEKGDEGYQEAAPTEKPEPVEKAVVKPDKKPVEKKEKAPVKKPVPEPEVKKPAVKRTDPEPVKDEHEIERAPEKQDKTSPEESEENTEAEQPGKNPDKVQGSQDNPSGSSSGEVNTNPGTEAPSGKTNEIQEITEGDITRRVTPGYPRASRLRREEGKVVIVAEIKDGKAAKVSIETSSGHQRLDRAALEAVKKWEFGFTEERTVRIPVIFRLRN